MADNSNTFGNYDLYRIYDAINTGGIDISTLATEASLLDLIAVTEDGQNFLSAIDANLDLVNENLFSNGQSVATYAWSTNQKLSSRIALATVTRQCNTTGATMDLALDTLNTAINALAGASGYGNYSIESSGVFPNADFTSFYAWAQIRCY